jgi:hypothetical protein
MFEEPGARTLQPALVGVGERYLERSSYPLLKGDERALL